MNVILLYGFILILVIISFIANKEKTIKALSIALKKFLNILPILFITIILVSIALYLIPNSLIIKYLGKDNMIVSFLIGIAIGSIVLMPGFIAFPLSAILHKKGVPYTVLASFTTTLMMVGFLTFPIEKEYFGVKVGIIRNIIGLIIAVITSIIIGIVFGEIL